MNKEILKNEKKYKPIVAICYDFDKTLSPNDMQAQGYIQSVGYDVASFWVDSNKVAKDNEMDTNLSYMYKMGQEAQGNFVFTKKALMEYGAKVDLFPGVKEWFGRIKKYGEELGITVEHYVISSGLKEMVEGTAVADAFKKIYACSFFYNDRGVAVWPAQVVNYTNKTQYLFRISKGVLDVNDASVNDNFTEDELRIPFRNIVYVGDSDTDVPCMKLVNSYGGSSIGVYNPDTKDKSKVYKMLQDNRIRYFAPADYREGTEIDKLVKGIINRTATNEILEYQHYVAKKEMNDAEGKTAEKELVEKKSRLILALSNSTSFQATHTTVSKMAEYSSWTEEEIDEICDIAIKNKQVKLILADKDVADFFFTLFAKNTPLTEIRQQVYNRLTRQDKK